MAGRPGGRFLALVEEAQRTARPAVVPTSPGVFAGPGEHDRAGTRWELDWSQAPAGTTLG
ncbi:hypothetical protein [Streptomyces sp. bgisy095]|uniref:hypothetical protein n=1 Tax=unclassified Streptomyces TaxID=2593676 RepID=UPI003D709804